MYLVNRETFSVTKDFKPDVPDGLQRTIREAIIGNRLEGQVLLNMAGENSLTDTRQKRRYDASCLRNL